MFESFVINRRVELPPIGDSFDGFSVGFRVPVVVDESPEFVNRCERAISFQDFRLVVFSRDVGCRMCVCGVGGGSVNKMCVRGFRISD